MPDAIKQISPKIFLLCFLWIAVGAVAPAALVVLMWLSGMASMPDWATLLHSSASSGGIAIAAFWRKHKAYLQLPPTLREVKALVATVTTEQTTQVTTTVSESHTTDSK